jgi:threonine dehydratase
MFPEEEKTATRHAGDSWDILGVGLANLSRPSGIEVNRTIGPIDVWEARKQIRPWVLRTPLLYSMALSKRIGCELYLKMECWQVCGSFKVRGVLNFYSHLTEEDRAKGLTAASSGNHGLALAYASKLLRKCPIKIFMAESAEAEKVGKLKLLGADVVVSGKDFNAAYDHAQAYARESKAIYVHGHSHPFIIAGHGTIGLEILEDLPDPDLIITPIGGGGLVAGLTLAVKSIAPQVRLIGVEPSAAPGAYLSLREGFAHEQVELSPSVADGLLGGFGALPFAISHDHIERVELVEEDEIIKAMKVFQQDEQLIVEGSGAVGLAALLAGKVREPGKKVVLIVTGRNIGARRFNYLMKA